MRRNMFGEGSSGNGLFPASLEGNRFQYNVAALPQLQLFGDGHMWRAPFLHGRSVPRCLKHADSSMDIEVDHYAALDLPSGKEGAKLSEIDISKAYRKRALELHPDKKPDDPINAHFNFQKLKASYDILKDEKKRRLFDDVLRMKREMIKQQQQDSKRRKMRSEHIFVPDINLARLEEEEQIAIKLLGEIARIREILLSKKESSDMCVDKEKVLKVSWGKSSEDYTCQKLKELFSNFGEVEHVIMSSNNKCYALVEMLSKDDAAKAVSSSVLHNLLIVPLQPPMPPFSKDAAGSNNINL
uniref:Pre-mRNA-splicing factor cwc23 n=1 Tax=Solanum tuberosum TaxID=4113 RepID=M1BJJ4_SOLTU